METQTGDLVWVDLGYSYGKWPATYQIGQLGKKEDIKLLETVKFEPSNNPEFNYKDDSEHFVKFFDDDSLEMLRVTKTMSIEPYITKQKLKYIKAGVKRHTEKKGRLVYTDPYFMISGLFWYPILFAGYPVG